MLEVFGEHLRRTKNEKKNALELTFLAVFYQPLLINFIFAIDTRTQNVSEQSLYSCAML